MRKIYTLAAIALSTILFAQVTQVKDINDAGNSSPANMYVYNGKIYFAADDSSGSNTGGTDYGKELWISDGTEAGTTFVKDIRDGSGNSSPGFFFELNSTLYFQANDGNGSSTIWTTDGTEAGTTNTNNGFSILTPIVINNVAYMTATTMGNTFYTFDGTTGTQVPDAGAGTANPLGGQYIALDDNTILLYMDYSTETDTVGRELYKYDIAAQTYTLVKDVDAGTGDSSISNFTKIGTNVYFEADNYLWVTDGTEAGTEQISSATSLSGVTNFYAWDNKLFFEGDNGTDGDQLYVYDPSAGTTTNISNISGTNSAHDPSDYVEYDGYLYYSGEDATDNKKHLFRTDGTSVEQMDSTIVDVDDLVVLNGKIYFEGDDNTTGNELYMFDPTTLSVVDAAIADKALSIYPNPATDVFYVNGMSKGTYEIYSTTGRMIQKGDFKENKAININLNTGMYLVRINDENQSVTQKLMVK